MKKVLFVFMYFMCMHIVFAQHEFFIRNTIVSGRHDVQIDGVVSTTPIIYIRGSLENDSGILIDSGEIQITGNITFTNHAVLRDSGEFVLLGGKSGMVNSFNSYSQIITGNFVDAFIGSNAFHSIIIDKPNWTPSNDSRIRLGQNVEISKSLSWQSGGIITTDLVSHADAGEAYQYEMYLKNPDPSLLSGYATTSGATNNYVVGKLRRQVDRIGDYYFPIGVEPGHGIGGMNACKIFFTSTPTNSGILGYLEKSGLHPLNNSVFYGDIGTDPGASGGDFSTCIGGPDGILDKMVATKHQDYQWSLIPNNPGTFLYSLEVIPTISCETSGIGENVSSACLSPYSGRSMTWLAHNGVPLGTPTMTINPVPLFPGTGYAVVPPSNYKIITGQSGFSKFRLHGVELLNTVLPIELISFTLSPIDNEYFNIQWVTTSEFNNDYFLLERSIDGITFTSITTIPGNGTSSTSHNYHFDDYDVLLNKRYYYRLKQVDTDGTFTYSSIISGIMSGTIPVRIFPNPISDIVISSVLFDRAEVYTMICQLVRTETTGTVINMSDLAQGEYIIKIFTRDQVNHFKIIKK